MSKQACFNLNIIPEWIVLLVFANSVNVKEKIERWALQLYASLFGVTKHSLIFLL
jgi:hypothetical protein